MIFVDLLQILHTSFFAVMSYIKVFLTKLKHFISDIESILSHTHKYIRRSFRHFVFSFCDIK